MEKLDRSEKGLQKSGRKKIEEKVNIFRVLILNISKKYGKIIRASIGGNMKKHLFLVVLTAFFSCTVLNTATLPMVESVRISKEVENEIVELKKVVEVNEYEKLKEFFLPTFKNNIIVNNIVKYDLSKLNFIFSDVKVSSKNKAGHLMIINYGSHSSYYNVVWKLKDGQWKISDVAEKR